MRHRNINHVLYILREELGSVHRQQRRSDERPLLGHLLEGVHLVSHIGVQDAPRLLALNHRITRLELSAAAAFLTKAHPAAAILDLTLNDSGRTTLWADPLTLAVTILRFVAVATALAIGDHVAIAVQLATIAIIEERFALVVVTVPIFLAAGQPERWRQAEKRGQLFGAWFE